MTKVKDLVCGDIITLQYTENSALFIGMSAHPDYPELALVIWKLWDDTVSFDALSWEQEVGFLATYRQDNIHRLKQALTHKKEHHD